MSFYPVCLPGVYRFHGYGRRSFIISRIRDVIVCFVQSPYLVAFKHMVHFICLLQDITEQVTNMLDGDIGGLSISFVDLDAAHQNFWLSIAELY